MKKLRKEKDTTFVVPFSWRGAMRLGRMPPHPEHIGDIMLAFRSIRMWKMCCRWRIIVCWCFSGMAR